MNSSKGSNNKVKGEDVLRKLPRQTRKRSTRKPKPKVKKGNSTFNQIKWVLIILTFVGVGVWFGLTFSEGINYFFSRDRKEAESKSLFDFRTAEVLSRHEGKMIGLDVSHYQGDIVWADVDSVIGRAPIEFAIIRSTMGVDGKDKKFKKNWKGAGANHFIRGAYHYYRPDENSLEQAKNFINTVTLVEGDLPPILDIEDFPKEQPMDSLIKGVKKWLVTVEKHYKVKPILYSGEYYYNTHLSKAFPEYTVWIANYNFFVEEIKDHWQFWQFTENGTVKGIKGKVDLNVYNGTKADIRKLLIK
ncbi:MULTISPECIES: GH25 family lysozyme [Myroides]|uniref:GH25 family lysozyme n=1 Tax=Myroides TaxID=76831 RepID=UPI001326984F|nr:MULTISPECIES: GH25 family lysozyme [Myroides]MVX35789.1 glycoside hydrolase family 25 protein [Myroides sp. LoEW2-1]UVD78272.1 glycoside hydrolase family 25 protein [Myroides albus]